MFYVVVFIYLFIHSFNNSMTHSTHSVKLHRREEYTCCVCACIYIYIYIYIYICVCVCVCVCASMRVCVCACVYYNFVTKKQQLIFGGRSHTDCISTGPLYHWGALRSLIKTNSLDTLNMQKYVSTFLSFSVSLGYTLEY